MDTSALALSAPNRYPQTAGPIHTIFVLVVLGGWTFYGKSLADSLNSAANPNRLRFYALTLFFEWLLFVLVIVGVRHSGAPVRIVLGDQWHSVRQVLRDIGIAAAFWIVSAGILFVVGSLLRVAALGRKMDFILPHGGPEITLWIALSVTAGICEETIFRGYLQRQFIALTKNVSRRHSPFCGRIRCRSRVPGLPDGDSDRPIRHHVWDSGPLARKRSPWNYRPCVAGFIERSACRFIEAIESAWCQ
jgi:membrane protease YdiL (CAAX protease family)